MVHGVIESVNMGSTHYAERIFDAVATTDIDNGTFGYLNGIEEGLDNVYKFVAGAPADGQAVVVVDQPAWTEDECRRSNQRKDNFFIPAGMPFRVRVVKKNDEFGVNIAAIAAASREAVEAVSDFIDNDMFLTIGTDGKLVASEDSTDGAVMEARIMRKRVKGATLVTGVRSYGYTYAIYDAQVKTMA